MRLSAQSPGPDAILMHKAGVLVRARVYLKQKNEY
jgi:hypothetical protein